MFYVKSEQHFDSAHFLEGYSGKCHSIHGHRWKVVVEIKGDTLGQEGDERSMLIDFNRLKQAAGDLCQKFDHALLYERGSLKELTKVALEEEGFNLVETSFRPTAEELARYFYNALKEKGFGVNRVEVYETPKTCAIYGE